MKMNRSNRINGSFFKFRYSGVPVNEHFTTEAQSSQSKNFEIRILLLRVLRVLAVNSSASRIPLFQYSRFSKLS